MRETESERERKEVSEKENDRVNMWNIEKHQDPDDLYEELVYHRRKDELENLLNYHEKSTYCTNMKTFEPCNLCLP